MVQTATVLYPLLDTVVDTGVGIDVRRLKDTYVSSATATSVRNPTQNTTVERRFDPANAADETAVNAATTNDKKGWAYSAADMTPSAGAAAWLPAQTCTVNYDGNASSTGNGAVGANDVFTPRASLWKYDPATDTATLIVGASGTPVSFPAATPYATTYTASVALTVPESTFAAGEVLMVVIGGALACGAGLLGAARTFVVRYTHSSGTGANVTWSAGMGELAAMVGTAAGTAAAAGVASDVLGTVGSAAGVGAGAGVGAARADTVGVAVGVAAVVGAASSVAESVGVAAGTSTAAGQAAAVVGTVGTVTIGAGGGAVRRPIYVSDD